MKDPKNVTKYCIDCTNYPYDFEKPLCAKCTNDVRNKPSWKEATKKNKEDRDSIKEIKQQTFL